MQRELPSVGCCELQQPLHQLGEAGPHLSAMLELMGNHRNRETGSPSQES